MIGKALSHGAATIINAMATGKGAAFGIALWTEAEVELFPNSSIREVEIKSDPEESATLAEKCVETVLNYFRLKNFGFKVVTNSNIPIARGLKSSSVASNAIVMATLSALGKKLSDMEILNLAVNAAIEANTTITGAFDDASASLLGNVVITDNLQRKIIKYFKIEDYKVVISIPDEKRYTRDVDIRRIKALSKQVEIAYKEALLGNYWNAMTINGLIYSAALKYPSDLIVDCLESGAIAAGISGKGPAIIAISRETNINDIREILSWYGKVIITETNKERAKTVLD
ncbi:MAG: shikimate kinase [Candidatus Bathyarchaeia archaeon]